MSVYILKTSIKPEDTETISDLLLKVIPKCKWNYDLEDCDHILKIESPKNIVQLVCFHLRICGFYCKELE